MLLSSYAICWGPCMMQMLPAALISTVLASECTAHVLLLTALTAGCPFDGPLLPVYEHVGHRPAVTAPQ
jgi:hypothetical protein